MQVTTQGRAEIAIRSLSKLEQRQITRALSTLSAEDSAKLRPSMDELTTSFADKVFFIYRGSPNLRLILSLDGDTWTVEDVINKDLLARLTAQAETQ